jgi:hypothetical protein
LSTLKLISLCSYFTDRDAIRRPEDHRANKMVKAIKGDEINGYFYSRVGGKQRKYTQRNVHEFVERIPRALATNIMRHCEGDATIVPIPNSHVVSVDTPNFRTLEIARKIAAFSEGKLKVCPSLVFREPQNKSRDGGPRDASHFEHAYEVLDLPAGPIVLFDDVCTGGGHLIGACRRLHCAESPVVLACTFGRSTKKQLPNPVGLREELLED